MRLIDPIELKRSIAVSSMVNDGKTLEQIIDEQPSVGQKTGRWILADNQYDEDVANGNYRYICSECGKSDIHAKTQEVPFCWWCGTKMKVNK